MPIIVAAANRERDSSEFGCGDQSRCYSSLFRKETGRHPGTASGTAAREEKHETRLDEVSYKHRSIISAR